MTSVWVMYQDNGEERDEQLGLGGVFTSYERAEAACVNALDQVWEEKLDVVLSREDSYADRIYFPAWGDSGLVRDHFGDYYDMGTGEKVDND